MDIDRCRFDRHPTTAAAGACGVVDPDCSSLCADVVLCRADAASLVFGPDPRRCQPHQFGGDDVPARVLWLPCAGGVRHDRCETVTRLHKPACQPASQLSLTSTPADNSGLCQSWELSARSPAPLDSTSIKCGQQTAPPHHTTPPVLVAASASAAAVSSQRPAAPSPSHAQMTPPSATWVRPCRVWRSSWWTSLR